MSPKREEEESDSLTAVDYIKTRDKLEKEARELMPFDPSECTYGKGELRQPIFACITCSDENNEEIGVCYSCSIQCHSSHELVELFTKRNFVCDCGTTKMSKTIDGGCKLRLKREENERRPSIPKTGYSGTASSKSHDIKMPAEDIPSLSNMYNQNFHGLFCSCEKPYNPLEETGNMIQCYFGFTCGEDWFHDECILGYNPGTIRKQHETKQNETGKNFLHKLSPPGEDAKADIEDKQTAQKTYSVPYFPELEDFDLFVCWKCVKEFRHIFKEIENDKKIILTKLPHFNEVKSISDWKEQYEHLVEQDEEAPKSKRIKIDPDHEVLYSVFLQPDFRDRLLELKNTLPQDSKLHEFLCNHDYLYLDDPIYECPEDNDGENSTTGSLYDLGTDALLSMPRDQAIEGLQAYEKISSKLKEFFKPFAEQGKVVTEEEVRDFFSEIQKKKDK